MSSIQKSSFSLDGEWRLAHKPAGALDYSKRPTRNSIGAKVPGDVHLDLMKAGKLPDPLIGDNAAKCAWIGEHEWWYSKSFKGRFHEGARHELVFEGLCLMAEVWLNGVHVASHDTMHRPLRVDVSKHIKEKSANLLVVRLKAFDEAALDMPALSDHAKWSDGIPDKRYCLKRVGMHKALYTFGWDWTQGLSVCGIWRGVRVESTPLARIGNVFVKAALDGSLDVSFESVSISREMRNARLGLRVREKASGEIRAEAESSVLLGPGSEPYSISAKVENPKLWWPVGLGEQSLYVAELSFSVEEGLLDRVDTVFGFRSVEIREGKASESQGTFKFAVNGREVFLKGANWIPPDIIPARATAETYRTLLTQTVECGMNYQRFWGGGIYEGPLFYELCDELGIMVWQEMMFSCPEFPDFDPAYVEESRKEVAHVVTSLRNHPSVIVWCGSNETDTIHMAGGVAGRPNGKYYGYRILHEVLPPLIGALDPTRAYIPSCPAFGKFSPPESSPRDFSFGTSHGNFANAFTPDAELDGGKIPAFLNECYANSPDPECSFRKYLTEEQVAKWTDPVFDAHSIMNIQYSGEHLRFSEELYHHNMARFNDVPWREKFAAFHDNHCELVKRYTEFLRRRMDVCGGVAFWMFDSAYTMMDWAFVDYYLVPKPVFYAAKRANVPLLPIVAVYGDRLDFHVASDAATDVSAELLCEVRSFDGASLLSKSKRVVLKANSSTLHLSVDRKALGSADPAACFAQATLKLDSGEVVRNYRYLVKIRELKLPVAKVAVEAVAGRPGEFVLSSDKFVRRVELAPYDEFKRPDDNYFDLLPGVPKTVKFSRPVKAKDLKLSFFNDESRKLQIVGSSKDEFKGVWRYELFNATDEALRLPLAVNGSEACSFALQDSIELAPRAIGIVEMGMSVDLFKMDKMDRFMPFDLSFGPVTVLESSSSNKPFSFKGGVISIPNKGRAPLRGSGLNFRCKTSSGRKLKLELPPLDIAPGAVFEHDLQLPADALPNTYELWDGKRKLCAFWGEPVKGGDRWNALPVAPFDGGVLKAFKCKDAKPDLAAEGNGYFVEPGMDCPGLEWIDESKGRFAFFLHYNARKLFFDIFVWDMPFRQSMVGEQVYKDSCVELVIGYKDNSRYLDYSMALTQLGPELFLRRGYSGFPHGKVKNPALEIFNSDHTQLTGYSCQLDLAEMNLKELFAGGVFKMALVVRGRDQRRIALFGGVQMGLGVGTAGMVELA